MSDALYAKIGRQQERIEVLDAAYNFLLEQFGKVVSGEIDRTRVLVNITERSFVIVPAGERPGLPSQINGLPVCVVAKDDDKETIRSLQGELGEMKAKELMRKQREERTTDGGVNIEIPAVETQAPVQ
jgi:hypothetical protein